MQMGTMGDKIITQGLITKLQEMMKVKHMRHTTSALSLLSSLVTFPSITSWETSSVSGTWRQSIHRHPRRIQQRINLVDETAIGSLWPTVHGDLCPCQRQRCKLIERSDLPFYRWIRRIMEEANFIFPNINAGISYLSKETPPSNPPVPLAPGRVLGPGQSPLPDRLLRSLQQRGWAEGRRVAFNLSMYNTPFRNQVRGTNKTIK